MATQRLTISVPQPCHENWQEMTPQLQGRFCQNCQKMVVDFTAMSDAEVVKWLENTTGRTCGRFSQKQLDRELVAPFFSSRRWPWRAALVGFAAWLSAKSTEAQTVSSKKENTEQSPLASISTTSESQASIYKGLVVDQSTGEPMPGVTIQLVGTTTATATDVNGLFELHISTDYLNNPKAKITISFIGYATETRQLSDLKTGKIERIDLGPDHRKIGEVVVIAGGAQIKRSVPKEQEHKQPGFFQRIIKKKL